MKQLLFVSALASALLVSSGMTLAADQKRDQDRSQSQLQEDQDRDRDQDQLYGSQLMTQEERAQQREKMRSAATAEEREQLRYEHHEWMEERAKERGVTIPDNMPAQGMGMGTGGMGMGSGSGSGSGN
jgi:hypothetical protein